MYDQSLMLPNQTILDPLDARRRKPIEQSFLAFQTYRVHEPPPNTGRCKLDKYRANSRRDR
jgi:hypothetical protein